MTRIEPRRSPSGRASWHEPGWPRRPAVVVSLAILALASGPASGQGIRAHRWARPDGAAGPSFAGTGSNARSLVFSGGRRVSLTHVLTDGAGYRWDIQHNGNIGQGTNYAFGSGLQLQVDNTQVPHQGQALLSEDGREVQIGPSSRGNIRVWRRIRVYEKVGLARWINVFENTGSLAETANVTVHSYFNYGLQSVTYQGGGHFGPEDTALVASTRRVRDNPSSMHVLCGDGAELRPRVKVQGNSLKVFYRLEIPAGQTVAVVYFCAQDTDTEDLTERMDDFRPQRYLRDLGGAARRAIVNAPAGYAHVEVALDRKEGVDRVQLKQGDPLLGRIGNERYALSTSFGDIELPAERVVGMLCLESDSVHCVLTDGQVVAGRFADQPIELVLSGGGRLRIPPDRINQWTYGIAPGRPSPLPFMGPYVVLRDGSRLRYAPETIELRFRARNDLLALSPGDLTAIQMDNADNGVHSALFANGGRLAGFLLPDSYQPKLALGARLAFSRNLIRQIEFAPEIRRDDTLTTATLTGGDQIHGQLRQETIRIRTPFGTVELDTSELHTVVFTPDHPGHVVAVKWDGSVLRGRLLHENLSFQIVPGPTVTLYPSQCVAIVRNQVLPPSEVLDRLGRLVLRLGAESYQDRERATVELTSMGPGVLDTLDGYRHAAREPEVRMRLDRVIEALRNQASPAETARRVRSMLRR